jgi:hypothetical protein
MHSIRMGHIAALGAILGALLLGGCFGIGSCSETEAFAFSSIDQYGDEQLVPEPHPSGACGASFVTSDDPEAVITHYRDELERVGFAVEPVEVSPITDESGQTVGRSILLQASIATATASLSAEVLGKDTTFVILMDEVE